MAIPEEKFEQKVKDSQDGPVDAPPKHANYVVVFIALALLTGIEILVSQLPLPRVPILVPLAVIKASLVALFYMHLRHDNKLFSAVFAAGILVAVVFLVAMMVIFGTHTTTGMRGM